MDKLSKLELTDVDILNRTPNILEQQIQSVMDKFDEACYHAFAQYGYDKDWISDPKNHKRISGIYESSDVSFGIPMETVFYLDNKPLFQVNGNTYANDYRTIWEFRIRYLAPLEEG